VTRPADPRRAVALAAALAAIAVTISAAPRLALAAGVLPDAARPFVWSDVHWTYAEQLSGGRLPYRDTWLGYPPGIGYLAGAFALLAGGPVGYVALWTALTALAAGAIGLLLARAAGPSPTLAYWSLSPQLLLLGGANFDALPIALLVVAVTLARHGKRMWALVALALGAVTKVFPAALAPLEIARLARDRGPAAAAAGAALFAGVVALVALPSLVAPWPGTISVLSAATRTNFASVWGIAEAGIAALGVPDPALLVGVVTLAGLAATYLVIVMPRARGADPARGGLLALLAVLLWSRLYSPQFSLWVLPFFVLLGVGVRRYALLSIADVVVFLSVYPLTLVPWSPADAMPTLLIGVLATGVALRHVALLQVWRDVSGRDTRVAPLGERLGAA
jgi:hypothetical protein